MTFNSFITKYSGKASDYDRYPSGDPVQCIDLIKYYLREVFNIRAGLGAMPAIIMNVSICRRGAVIRK